MGRNIEIDARRGGGAAHEILFGEVTIEATALRQDGTKTVFPAPTTIGISNGTAVLENVDVSPAGPEPAWAYRMTFRDHMSGRGWSEMVGVPTGTTAVKYPTLPRFTAAIPPETTKADLQNWVATTEAAKNTAVQAAATATAPTDAMVAGKIKDSASATATALSAAIGMSTLTVNYDARMHGKLAGNGTTDDSAKFQEFIDNIPTPTNTFGDVGVTVHIPAGRYILDGSFVFDKRITITGDGPYGTILYRKSNASGDFITLNGPNSVIRELSLDGNRFNGTSGDNLVLNGANTAARYMLLVNAGGNGITVGKTAKAINYRIESLSVNYSKLIGIHICAFTGTSDGKWVNVGIGQSGKQGVKIDEAAQQLVNVHSWGNGVEAAGSSEGAGYHITSSSNTFTNCQSETNWTGFFVTGTQSIDNNFGNCNAWGNRGNGLYILNANGGVWSGGKIHKNGVGNTDGSQSTSFAGIKNEGGSFWTIGVSRSFDTSATIPPGAYTYTPLSPFPGRAAISTQSQHYVEVAGTANPNNNTVSGNTWRSQETRSGSAVTTIGSLSVWAGNNLGAHPLPVIIADGAALVPKPETDLMKVDGTGTVNNISTTYAGRKITLIFINATPGGVWSGTGNLRLSANFVPTTGSALSLVSDGENWYETGRSGGV